MVLMMVDKSWKQWVLVQDCCCISKTVNLNYSVNKVPTNPFRSVGALMTLIDFTLSNARQLYSSMGNPLAVKGLIQWEGQIKHIQLGDKW